MRKRQKQKKHTLVKVIIIGGIIIIISIGYQWYRYENILQTPVDAGDVTPISFVIKPGENLDIIGKSLLEKQVILDANVFKTYGKLNHLDTKILSGRFIIGRNLTIPQIFENLTKSENSQVVLTVPEGFTISDIDKKITELGLIQSGDFIKATKEFNDYGKYPFLDKQKNLTLIHPLEGFLFPDTYYLNPQNFSSADLISMMLNNFQTRLGDEIKTNPSRSWNEIITMASIIEKEVHTSKDVPIVSGILWKRLDENWMIGADATLLYLKNDREIDTQDLQEDSPYNTRKNLGLPPGPISNPGLKSIKGALHPEESPYYFYLTKAENGEVVYARTNDEHNANKYKYL